LYGPEPYKTAYGDALKYLKEFIKELEEEKRLLKDEWKCVLI
jgi:hypothetical protein